ncbi:TRAP transporter small permease [Fulvimarina sp. 2208YS6-2-32]|uniref:TRAP transporter small permease protein n=1 Tax=Fulvimarina uroteuthidis TaxID=3098149 RepID=A0ABU5I492_9HYPH|nr:TRAP transporter small permease [Fulvimarina sp. 2208YS6-2-32]MDY8110188.1 TRAP transporter small permease [Fulvimarina sp. 2208YS6-2-32]
MRFLLDEAEKLVCAVIFLAMTALGFANVVVRYLTNYSFAATQELLLDGFLLLTVFGAAIAARRGEHLAVTIFTDVLPASARRIAVAISAALSVLLLALSAWFTMDLVRNQMASGITSSGMQIPEWYVSTGLPVGFALIAVRLIQTGIAEWREPGGVPDSGLGV